MDAKVNYTIVGLIGIILIAVLIGILIFLSHASKAEHYTRYVSYFKQDLSGLGPSSKVKVNGINVGEVESIHLDKKDITKVEVLMQIDSEIPVTTSSYTVVQSEGLTGQEYIALKTTNPNATRLTKKSDQKYIVIPTKASLLTDVEGELKSTSKEIKVLVARANDLLKENNREAIDRTLQSIEKVTQTVANNSANINASLQSMQAIMKNASTASNDLPRIAKQTLETMRSIDELADQFSKTGHNATLTLSKTNTAVQNITNQLIPTAEQLMQQLSQMISTLNQFGQELSHNPSMLIRGKYPSPPGPGEK